MRWNVNIRSSKIGSEKQTIQMYLIACGHTSNNEIVLACFTVRHC